MKPFHKNSLSWIGNSIGVIIVSATPTASGRWFFNTRRTFLIKTLLIYNIVKDYFIIYQILPSLLSTVTLEADAAEFCRAFLTDFSSGGCPSFIRQESEQTLRSNEVRRVQKHKVRRETAGLSVKIIKLESGSFGATNLVPKRCNGREIRSRKAASSISAFKFDLADGSLQC